MIQSNEGMQTDAFLSTGMTNELTKMKIQAPLMELIKISTYKETIKMILVLDENEAELVICQGIN
jgi:hypothetical protein